MILPDFRLPEFVNSIYKQQGIDSIEKCIDKKLFQTYPYDIVYTYNSRGFRDSEWPTTAIELQNAIWCFGDSFTAGLGSALPNTWVQQLQKTTGRRCINISMDGASNSWIARHVLEVIDIVKPKDIVIHWSYLWRGESQQQHLTDRERRSHLEFVETDKMLDNFLQILKKINYNSSDTNIVHSVIPGAKCCDKKEIEIYWNNLKGENWPQLPQNLHDFNQLPFFIIQEINRFGYKALFENYFGLLDLIGSMPNWINEFEILDFARDGWHYDKKTAENFVKKIMNYL